MAPTTSSLDERALLCAYYPQQLLPGLASILELRRHLGQDRFAPVTVMVWSDPGVGSQFLGLRREAFEQLLAALPWVTLVFPSPQEIKAQLSPNSRVATKARHLRRRFGDAAFGIVSYAHDMGSDYFSQSAMQAFPGARRACFGDALGVVYTNDYYTRLTYPLGPPGSWLRSPGRMLVNLLWRCKRAYTLPRRHGRLDAEFAVPILPCDPGGDFLAGKALLHVRRDTLELVLNALVQGAEPEHPDPKLSADRHVMLLGSFSESGFTSEEQEKDMYLEAARLHIPPGTRLLLKAHPASYGTKVRDIALALQHDYEVELCRVDALPVEALRSLAASRSVISFSYSSVSLHYLHGSTVAHAMTAELIEKYFPPPIRQWMHESNVLYLEQLEVARQLRHRQLDGTGSSAAPVTGTQGDPWIA